MEMFAHSYTDNGECKRQNEGAIIFDRFVENLTFHFIIQGEVDGG